MITFIVVSVKVKGIFDFFIISTFLVIFLCECGGYLTGEGIMISIKLNVNGIQNGNWNRILYSGIKSDNNERIISGEKEWF